MKVKALAALAGAAMVSGIASAEMLTAQVSTAMNNSYINTVPQPAYSTLGLQTALVSVSGMAPGSSLLAVTGIPGAGLTINTSGAGFTNAGEVGQVHWQGNSALFPVFNDLQWDTYIALNGNDGGGNPFNLNPTGITPGFPGIALAGGGAPIVGDENISWFNGDPGNPVFERGGAVVIGQFTVPETESIAITLNIEVVDAAGQVSRILGLTLDIPPVPAPGALALLGIAGLAGTRRRRA